MSEKVGQDLHVDMTSLNLTTISPTQRSRLTRGWWSEVAEPASEWVKDPISSTSSWKWGHFIRPPRRHLTELQKDLVRRTEGFEGQPKNHTACIFNKAAGRREVAAVWTEILRSIIFDFSFCGKNCAFFTPPTLPFTEHLNKSRLT